MATVAYDADANALYITLDPHVRVDRTIPVDDSTNCDLDDDGNLIGVEVLNPGRIWPLAAILRDYEVGEQDAAALIGACPFQVQVSTG